MIIANFDEAGISPEVAVGGVRAVLEDERLDNAAILKQRRRIVEDGDVLAHLGRASMHDFPGPAAWS